MRYDIVIEKDDAIMQTPYVSANLAYAKVSHGQVYLPVQKQVTFMRLAPTAFLIQSLHTNPRSGFILARHDVWRRAAANWLAGLLVRHVIDRQDAEVMIVDLAVGLAKKAYRF